MVELRFGRFKTCDSTEERPFETSQQCEPCQFYDHVKFCQVFLALCYNQRVFYVQCQLAYRVMYPMLHQYQSMARKP